MRLTVFILYASLLSASKTYASLPYDLLAPETKTLLNTNINSMIDGLTNHMDFSMEVPSDPKHRTPSAAPYELRLDLLPSFINIILANKEKFESQSWKNIHRFFEEELKTQQPLPELLFNYETIEFVMSLLIQTRYITIHTENPSKYSLNSGTAFESARLLYLLTLPKPPKVINNTKKKKRTKKKRPHTSDAAE